MAQRLYMILLEDDPEDPGFSFFDEAIREGVLDTWDNCGYSAMQAVLDVHDYDPDGSDGTELNEALAELQEEIKEAKS